MKKVGPYIGITGFMTLAEVVQCNNTFCKAVDSVDILAPLGDLKFMVGVLVSSTTLVGSTNKYPNRYPAVGRVHEILSLRVGVSHLLHTIHYNTKDATTIDEQIDQVMGLDPSAIDAIQLNIRWVNPLKLQRVKRKYPSLRIILQIGAGALDDVTEPEDIYIGDALRSYDGIVDDFLVDPSGGNGEPFDIWRVFACVADSDIPRSIRPGVAGGRDADNVREIKGLMRRLGTVVNIDAQGRMRTPRQGNDGDHLDLGNSSRFIKACVALMSEARGGRAVRVAA